MTMPDNATPHTSRATKNLVEEFGWEELTELFNGTKAYFKRRGQNEARFLFESKLATFYEEGMRKLVARWEDVIDKNGDFVEH
ncbi:hypothetical protein ACTXT7_010310 [Hymenolepis weldensis]